MRRNALTLVDLVDRDEVRRALRVAFKIRPRDRAVFDALFDAFWTVAERRGASVQRRFRAAPVVPRSAGGRAAGDVQLAPGRD